MSDASHKLYPGKKVTHTELGEGVVINLEPTGFVRVFFQNAGERQVQPDSLSEGQTWIQQVVSGLKPATPELLLKLRLAIEAEELPLVESSATLTSAKIDLLPHQVVLVHRVSNTQPRRFMIADEVGLGKTIEAALIVRELAFRGELERALIIVPAGLVDNWRRELNEVFNLDFEVFGADGDVTDRRSNAFIKHHRLIASIDTLKRPSRVKKLLEAPLWDIIVFDEAHHLTATRNGNKVTKTENFKLAQALRDHSRDMVLLSATPHQGDNFRFWMLVRLLHPGLFQDEKDMIDNRHRLNAVVIRRTKADACAKDGGSLFARRMVNTQAFMLSEEEKAFYQALTDYLQDGYNIAITQGNRGRALGFVMTIFQKIAASSFAAVKLTLQKRLLMLTIQEAIEQNEALNVDDRDHLYREAIEIIKRIHNLPSDTVGQAQAEQILADSKLQLLKKRQAKLLDVLQALSDQESEITAATKEETVAIFVEFGLPEERQRIYGLLNKFPKCAETKAAVLTEALKQFWQQNTKEKIVIFATYLGTVDIIRDSIQQAFPDKSVEVLKGGDHGAKVAAQRRFKRPDGPSVLVCTAAGREGINLQFARILFNYDLPWNPMDIEQRIGRIHRYGQQDTAQVYNLVAANTIEGRIFLMLEEKLKQIAKTLGKVDENGQVAEDFRSQILGQMNTRLSYDKLYQEALSDPTLRRTQVEIDEAMRNANLARDVVFELFQDLDRFDLEDYKAFDDKGAGMQRLVQFVQSAASLNNSEFTHLGDTLYELHEPASKSVKFTTDRDKAIDSENLELLGLEHPIVERWLSSFRNIPASDRALSISPGGDDLPEGILTLWHVSIHAANSQVTQKIVKLGLNFSGERLVNLERASDKLLTATYQKTNSDIDKRKVDEIISTTAEKLLNRELSHAGLLQEGVSYSSRLLGCVVIK
jgi:SNF2 family DNA or RNA helicase